MRAACEGREADVEALVTSSGIDINAPLFEVSTPWLGYDDAPKEEQPLLHAWLYHCFVLADNGSFLLDAEARMSMMTMMVQRLGAKLVVRRSLKDTDSRSDFQFDFKNLGALRHDGDGVLYVRPCDCSFNFNAMDFVWFRCMRNRWLGGGEEMDNLIRDETRVTVMQMEELDPEFISYEVNNSILGALFTTFSFGLVRDLHAVGFASNAISLPSDLATHMFSVRRWKEYGWLFLVRCDCEGVVQFILQMRFEDELRRRCFPGFIYSTANAFSSGCRVSALPDRLVELYSNTMANDPNRYKIASMMEMLMHAGVGWCDRLLNIWAYRIDPIDTARTRTARRRVQMLLPVSDPMKRLAVRGCAIKQDNVERSKLGAFFFGYGKLLGRDIVQTHILPRVIVLGGKDQAKVDTILDRNHIPTEVRECAFYYQCLIARTKSDLIVGEFRFMRFLMSAEGRREYEDVMDRMERAFDGFFDHDRIADVVLGALRASFNACALGVPSACPAPPV